MKHARPPRVFTVTGAVVLFVLIAVVVIALLVDAVVRSGFANMLLLAPWPLLALWVAYVVGTASDVRADETGVQVQNLLRRTWMPWSRVKKIDVRWQLEFTLDDGSVVPSLGGPARSRPRRIGPERTRETENAAAGDGIAKLQKLRVEAAPAPDAVVQRTWDAPALLALGIIVVWAIAAVLITQL